MVVSVRLEVPIENSDVASAVNAVRTMATSMGVTISRVKERDDVVQLYGTKKIA